MISLLAPTLKPSSSTRKTADIGILTFGKGILTFEDTLGIGSLTAASGKFDSRIRFLRSAQLAAPTTVSSNGLTVAAGQTLTFPAPLNCVESILDGGGTLSMPGGIAMIGNGTLDTATLLIPAGTTGTMTGAGSVRWLFYNSAALDKFGTFPALNNHTLTRNTAGDNARVLNSGTFTRGTGTGTFTCQIPFQNSGTVNVDSGRLTLSFLVTYAGTRNVVLSGYLANPAAPVPPTITSLNVTPADVTLTWVSSGTPASLQVQTSTSLLTGTWQNLGIPAPAGASSITAPHPGGPLRFFRLGPP